MKQRVLSIKVFENENVLFEKSAASPQDLMAALTLFERDSLRVEICMDVIDVNVTSRTKN